MIWKFIADRIAPHIPAPETPRLPAELTSFGMFEPEEIKVYAGDADITDQLETAMGIFRNGQLMIRVAQPSDKLSNDNGVIRIVPFPVSDGPYFTYGGIGTWVAGVARVHNGRGEETLGTARWVGPNSNPASKYAIEIILDGEPLQQGNQMNFYYGIIADIWIPVP